MFGYRLGRKRLIGGTKVMIISAIRKAAINGADRRAMRRTEIPVKELATNRLTPIGGVTNPIARLTTMITPK